MDDVAHHRAGPFLIIRTFLVEAFRIPTQEAWRARCRSSDFLLVNKAVYGARVLFARARTPAVVAPERGDVVVFLPPHEPAGNNVKRLLGMPGDTLEMHDIVLFLNGGAWSEDYVRFSDPVDVYSSGMSWQCEHAPEGALTDSYRPTRDNRGPIVVPDGCHFMLGDNRDDSETPAIGGSSSATRFAAGPSSSNTRSIPCPDALRDGSPVSAGAAPAVPCCDVSGLA